MDSTCEVNRVQVTDTVYDLLHTEFDFECRGEVPVKGKGSMITYYLQHPRKLCNSH
jgi:adenylate cyclase